MFGLCVGCSQLNEHKFTIYRATFTMIFVMCQPSVFNKRGISAEIHLNSQCVSITVVIDFSEWWNEGCFLLLGMISNWNSKQQANQMVGCLIMRERHTNISRVNNTNKSFIKFMWLNRSHCWWFDANAVLAFHRATITRVVY